MLYDTFTWLENLPLVLAFSESLFAYPLVQGIHVLALAVAVGLLALTDLRLAGVLLTDTPVRTVVAELRPWFVGGYIALFITGILLFLPKATLLYASKLFWIKLVLIVLAGLNALYFEFRFHRSDSANATPARTLYSEKIPGLTSLGLWVSIIVLGRLLAYF